MAFFIFFNYTTARGIYHLKANMFAFEFHRIFFFFFLSWNIYSIFILPSDLTHSLHFTFLFAIRPHDTNTVMYTDGHYSHLILLPRAEFFQPKVVKLEVSILWENPCLPSRQSLCILYVVARVQFTLDWVILAAARWW